MCGTFLKVIQSYAKIMKCGVFLLLSSVKSVKFECERLNSHEIGDKRSE